MLTDKIVGFFVTIRIVVQLNLFLDRLHGSPIGFSILGIFVIEKNTLPTVCIQRGRCVYSVSQKNLPPLRYSEIFPKRLRIFNKNFTRLLLVHTYAKLQNFIQLSPTMTMLCRIKRDHPVNFYISQHICHEFY